MIRLLKEAKDFIHLVVKRKLASSPNNGAQPHHQVETSTDQAQNSKRHNLAIQHTAATVMANFNNTNNNGGQMTTSNGKENSSKNLMTQMMSGTTAMSSLKPFKVTLSKKEKKDTFGVVLGCKYYIKEIVPNSLAANEANLRKGDILLKINDLTSDQFSLCTARKILLNQKSRENKVHLVVKRNSMGSSLSSVSDDDGEEDETELAVDETPIQVAMATGQSAISNPNMQHPQMPPPPPPMVSVPKSPANNQHRVNVAPEIPPRPNYQNCAQTSNTSTPVKQSQDHQASGNDNNVSNKGGSLIKQLFKPVRTSVAAVSTSQVDSPSGGNNRLSKFYSKYAFCKKFPLKCLRKNLVVFGV